MKTFLFLSLFLSSGLYAADAVAISSADGKGTTITITMDTTAEQAVADTNRKNNVPASQVKKLFTQAVLQRASQILATSAQTAQLLPSDIDAQAAMQKAQIDAQAAAAKAVQPVADVKP